jgi:transposase InsO family protein
MWAVLGANGPKLPFDNLAVIGKHEFDTLCSELGIDRRLTQPQSPQTNGMVERFNGCIALMTFKAVTFDQGKTLMRRCTVMYCSIINNSRSLFFRPERPCKP